MVNSALDLKRLGFTCFLQRHGRGCQSSQASQRARDKAMCNQVFCMFSIYIYKLNTILMVHTGQPHSPVRHEARRRNVLAKRLSSKFSYALGWPSSGLGLFDLGKVIIAKYGFVGRYDGSILIWTPSFSLRRRRDGPQRIHRLISGVPRRCIRRAVPAVACAATVLDTPNTRLHR